MNTLSLLLFLWLLNWTVLYEIKEEPFPVQLLIDTPHCNISPGVFKDIFTVWNCSELGYQEIIGHCGSFLTMPIPIKPYQIPTLSKNTGISKIMLHNKDIYLANAECCIMDFYSFNLLSKSELTVCDIVIVMGKSKVLHYSRRGKLFKRSAKQNYKSLRLSKKRGSDGESSNFTGAMIYNSTVRISREANATSMNRSKFNETELEIIEEKLALKFSHDPEWAMISMTSIILLLLCAVKCCKLTQYNQSKLQYVDYIDDWHTSTVYETAGRKFTFLDILKRFKKRKKKRQKKSDEKERLIYNKRSHSDGEDNILDESENFINL
ncbi:uncharacterized protein LOC133204669 [Saccostrea echinata]|uniref:uncharacterized protein LOC133204669 n=1 Tax=Saccostrea echinata TaxID=191078 RepID=UPI002A801B14|nr:uncharacterized protein LOC133204669 [Saccostrea echinata]